MEYGATQAKFPQLFSFCKKPGISIMQAKQHMENDNYDLFHNPLSMIAADQYQEVYDIINAITSDEKDVWSFPWSGNKYRTYKVYTASSHLPRFDNIDETFCKFHERT